MNIETLYTNGCSWTSGDGLLHDPQFDDYRKNDNTFAGILKAIGGQKKYAWPATLGKKLNIENVVNEATGGGSNDRIFRMTTEWAAQISPAQRSKSLVVLGWTTVERSEIFLEGYSEDGTSSWHRMNAGQKFSTYSTEHLPIITVKAIEKMRELWIGFAHSELGAYEKFATQVFALKNTLENLGIPYLFFSSLMFLGRADPDFMSKINHFRKMIDGPNYLSYDETYLTFLTDRNLPMSPCFHPLLSGIDAWTDNLVLELQKRGYVND